MFSPCALCSINNLLQLVNHLCLVFVKSMIHTINDQIWLFINIILRNSIAYKPSVKNIFMLRSLKELSSNIRNFILVWKSTEKEIKISIANYFPLIKLKPSQPFDIQYLRHLDNCNLERNIYSSYITFATAGNFLRKNQELRFSFRGKSIKNICSTNNSTD